MDHVQEPCYDTHGAHIGCSGVV